MALFLGKTLGRPILNTVRNNKWLSRKVFNFGQRIHRVIPRYTPGLTSSVFDLYDQCVDGDIVQVKSDGLYKNDGKIAGNMYVAKLFSKYRINEFTFNSKISPEEFLAQSRDVIFGFAALINGLPGVTTVLVCARINNSDRTIFPPFIAEHINTVWGFAGLSILGKFFILNPILSRISKNANIKKIAYYSFWLLTAATLVYYETIGIFDWDTADPLDIPFPLYAMLSTLFMERAYSRFKTRNLFLRKYQEIFFRSALMQL